MCFMALKFVFLTFLFTIESLSSILQNRLMDQLYATGLHRRVIVCILAESSNATSARDLCTTAFKERTMSFRMFRMFTHY